MILEAQKRDIKENLQNLRKGGFIPAVVYGPKQEALSIKLNTIEFKKAYREAGESTVVELSVDGDKHEVLIQQVDRDAIKGEVLHVDFYAIEKGKKVTVNVPLEFVGEAPAEKTLGGVLVKVLHEVEIEAMPKDLPHEIEVSIDSLVDFEAQIHAKDLIMPNGVTLLTDADEVVVLVQAHKEEVEEAVEFDPNAVKTEGEIKKAESGKDEE